MFSLTASSGLRAPASLEQVTGHMQREIDNIEDTKLSVNWLLICLFVFPSNVGPQLIGKQ